MKHVWRTKEKHLYIAKKQPELISIPELKYFVISGQGNPNEASFQECVQALYTLSYAIRMMPKNGETPEGYFEYTVYPLEGVWTSTQAYEVIQEQGQVDTDLLVYDVMIRQPDFVDQALFEKALLKAAKKLNEHQLRSIRFETHEAHKAVQMLHTGPYASEMETFRQMQAYIENEKLSRVDQAFHKEIYLRMDKTDSERNQTTLRYSIEG